MGIETHFDGMAVFDLKGFLSYIREKRKYDQEWAFELFKKNLFNILNRKEGGGPMGLRMNYIDAIQYILPFKVTLDEVCAFFDDEYLQEKGGRKLTAKKRFWARRNIKC